MEIRRQVYDVPASSGSYDFNISGWSETPKAIRVVMFHDRTDDSAEVGSFMSVGFTDGTTEGAESCSAIDNVTTTDTWRESVNNSLTSDPYYQDIICNFNQWNTGGVKLDFSGGGLSYQEHRIEITFFAGTDVSAAVFRASPGDHVTSLSFTSKLIFAACTGQSVSTQATEATLGVGIATNGSNGLTQQFVEYVNADGAGTSSLGGSIYSGYIMGQNYSGSWSWQTTISSIDSNGFNLSDSDTDSILFLCLTFDEDVDSGTDTVPTSGNLTNTDAGFLPQFLDILGTINITTLSSWDESKNYQGIIVGGYDGTREQCVGIVGRDNVGTTEEYAFHASQALHSEDTSQSAVFDASFSSFTSSGFNLTVNTNPGTAAYFIWMVLESGSQSGTVAESCSIGEAQSATQTTSSSGSESASMNDTPSAQAVFNVSVSESCSVNDTPDAVAAQADSGSESATIDDAPTAQASFNSAGSESATIDDAPSAQAEINDSGSESVTIDDAPSASQVQSASVSESATIDESEDAVSAVAVSVSESAGIDDAPSVQADFSSIAEEDLLINETQLASGDTDRTTAETMTLDEAQTVQAELNDSGSESLGINEQESASGDLQAQGSESLAISAQCTAQLVAAALVEESLDLDESSSSSGAITYVSVSESLAIGETADAAAQGYEVITGSSEMTEVLELDSEMTQTLELDSEMTNVLNLNSYFQDE